MPLAIEPAIWPLATDATGTVRVAGTRVTIDSIVHRFSAGDLPEEIAVAFPSVPLADIYLVLAYYIKHRGDVDAYLHERRRQADETRADIAQNHPEMTTLRDRLMARSASRRNTA